LNSKLGILILLTLAILFSGCSKKEGNKLNIKPKQKVKLTAFLPYKGINKEALAINEPDVKCIGYWNELDEYHQFSFGGSLKQE
jgi:PBP1b-binding outer membrane lipoprotein LpoB